MTHIAGAMKMVVIFSSAVQVETCACQLRHEPTTASKPLLPPPFAQLSASRDQARGEPAKNHPVVRRILSLRSLLGDMASLDERLEPQVELLLRALAAGVDLAGAGGESGDESDSRDEEEDGKTGKSGGSSNNTNSDSSEESEGELDEEGLEEEEARFMGNENASSSDDDEGDKVDDAELSPAAAKKRRRAVKKKTLAKAKAKAAVVAGNGDGDASLGDFGDEDMDDDQFGSGSRVQDGVGGGSGGNLLQGMVNRISQREQAAGRRSSLQGDLDVPIRERDQTIRVRRPIPSDNDDEGDGSGGGGDDDSEEDDLGLGGDGFMRGLPPGLLEGLSRSGGGERAGENKDKKGKRTRDADTDDEANVGGEEDGGEEEDGFYESIALAKERKKRAKEEKYHPQARIAGALEAELEAEREARGGGKRGASYAIIKNRGLTPHKNKLNRNPRAKKREAFRKAAIRRKGQVSSRVYFCSVVWFEARSGERPRRGNSNKRRTTRKIDDRLGMSWPFRTREPILFVLSASLQSRHTGCSRVAVCVGCVSVQEPDCLRASCLFFNLLEH